MNFRINWEGLGIAASVACAIHCALMPLFISSLPLFGVNLVHNPLLELLLLGLAFGIGISTLWHGYKKHHHRIITLLSFSVGIALFVAHQFVHIPHATLILIVPGIAAILTAHFLNHRYCRAAKHCHTDDCNH
ncbi:MAG: MerC domain-containing protein [Lacibacter sp.]|jgi:hypothetical protein